MAIKSMVATIAALDAATAKLTPGGSELRIYADGAAGAPATVDTPITDEPLLVTCLMDATLPVQTPSTADGSQAKALCNPISSGIVATDGTCTFWRMVDDQGTAVFQGTAGTAGNDLVFTDPVFVTGGNVSINDDFALTLGI